MILSGDDSTDDGTQSVGRYVEPRAGDSECAEDATSYDDCNEMDASDSCFAGKDKTKWGKVKSSTHTHTRRRWQNILTKLPGVIGQARNATTPFEAWSGLSSNEILDNILLYTNQCILNIQPNFAHESDAKLTDKIEMNVFIGLLCSAGELRINKQSVEELWGTDGDGTENFRVVMNYRRLKFLVRCILEKTKSCIHKILYPF
jgi:hypothetical protein